MKHTIKGQSVPLDGLIGRHKQFTIEDGYASKSNDEKEQSIASDIYYQEKLMNETKVYQDKIEELKARIEEYQNLIDLISDNKGILFQMFIKAIQQLSYERHQSIPVDIDPEDSIKDLYAAYSNIDELYHQITGEYLL